MADSGSFSSAASSLHSRALIVALTLRPRRMARGDDSDDFFAMLILAFQRKHQVFVHYILDNAWMQYYS